MILRIVKLILLAAIIFVAWFAWQLWSPNSLETQSKKFVIAEGESVNQISQHLHQAGLIKSKLAFETYLWATKSEARLIAGSYNLAGNYNIPAVAVVLMGGGNDAGENNLTFIEGLNRKEYAAYLDSHGFSGQEFLDLTASASDWSADFTFLKGLPADASLEGFLFPDTYSINNYTTEETIIRRMLKTFDSRTADLRSQLQSDDRSLFEVVTLASIIEHEVSDSQQRRAVAGIFYNRLSADIGLQSDATVNFITGKSERRPTTDDLEIDSPYNTYKYRGLPPGPISNPSLDSLEATVSYDHNDYLYFLHNQAGEIYYAKTFEEHQQNRELYLD